MTTTTNKLKVVPPDRNAAAFHPRRVLVVEDDSDLRNTLADTLIARGHKVVAVVDGREALKQMRLSRPDIVLLDLMMPVMDGWQFRVEQKRDPSIAETPVVAISASHSPTAAAMDADAYLQKPVDARTLLQAIEDVLVARERRAEPAKIAHSERMASLGTLAAGMAHEINNPLTYVLLHLTQASRQLQAISTEANRKRIDQIDQLVRGALEGVERIRGITAGIRAFSRSWVDDARREPLDPRATLDAALRLTGNEIRHRARLTREMNETPAVLANEGRLGQVFLNLLTNAVQALPEGDAAANEVKVTTCTTADGWACIEITDTGCGIAEHLLPRIFEPFFSTKPLGQGTGLGLSISHGIITAMGGVIEVVSEVDMGTTFRVKLPPARAELAAEPRRAVGRRIEPAPHRRILVVDDEPGVCAAIRNAFFGEHEVHSAGSGREALALLEQDDAWDTILCDLHMPDGAGMDLPGELEKLHSLVADKIIFMTAGAFTERARDVIASTRRPCIEKPIDLDQLRALLARAT